MGLVKQCLSSLYKKNIQRLTKTFLTLSLQDMASRVQLSGPQEAEKYVLHMAPATWKASIGKSPFPRAGRVPYLTLITVLTRPA
nr:COP9 signalosome complex subunit 3-like isoform X2 [Aotus nancymaae]